MNTKAAANSIDNQNPARGDTAVLPGSPSIAEAPGISTGDNIIDRVTTGAASGGIANDPSLTSNDRAPKGQGPSGLLGVEQAYDKGTGAYSPAALVGDLPR